MSFRWNIRRRGPSRADVIGRYADVPASDYLTFMGNIENFLSDIRNQLPGYTTNAFFIVRVRGMTARSHGNPQPFSHVFTGQLIRNRQYFYREFERWAQEYIYGDSDWSPLINRVVINVIRQQQGGCWKKGGLEKEGDVILQVFRSTQNNCGFQVLKECCNFAPKLTLTVLDDIRNKYKWGYRTPLEPSHLLRLFLDYRRHENDGLIIVDSEMSTIEVIPSTGGVIHKVVLEEEHYKLYKGEICKLQCNRCYKWYVKRHRCRYEGLPQCFTCWSFHLEGESCNRKRVSYINTQKKGNAERYLLDRIEPYEWDVDKIVHYDIETHHKNELDIHTPYIVGFYDTKDGYQIFTGEDCMERFVSRFVGWDHPIYLNAYNGAAFDHLFLVKAAVKLGHKIKKFTMQNGSIIGLRIGSIKVFDLHKHLTGTLAANLKDWGCSILKGDFDHNQANTWELMPPNLQEDCKKYLQADVMGLKELYEKVAKTYHDQYGVLLYDYISASQLTFDLWKRDLFTTSRKNVSIVLPNTLQEVFFRSSIFGGRTYKCQHRFISTQYMEVMRGELVFDQVQDYLLDLDAVSLYPSAMAMYPYPVNECYFIEDINKWNETIRKKRSFPHMSVVHVRYEPPRNLAHAILPRRDKHGVLRWDLERHEGYYNSVDLENALRFGYTITITERGGWYWKDEEYIYEHYINECYKEKSEAEKGSPSYMTAKLKMNGLYGKNIQRPIYKQSKWCSNDNQFWTFFNKNDVTEFEYINDLLYIAGEPKNEEDREERITKPSHLGSFILAYSRRIMLDAMEKSNPHFQSDNSELQRYNDFYYTDTDSIQMHVRNAFEEKDCLGGFTDDLKGGGKIIRGIWIAPKLYMLEYITRENEIHHHIRGKGVDVKKMTIEMFERMHTGESIRMLRDFQMKKITTKRNNQQMQFPHFSIIHQEGDSTARVLNTAPWIGRYFFEDGSSTPFGHHSIME